MMRRRRAPTLYMQAVSGGSSITRFSIEPMRSIREQLLAGLRFSPDRLGHRPEISRSIRRRTSSQGVPSLSPERTFFIGVLALGR